MQKLVAHDNSHLPEMSIILLETIMVANKEGNKKHPFAGKKVNDPRWKGSNNKQKPWKLIYTLMSFSNFGGAQIFIPLHVAS